RLEDAEFAPVGFRVFTGPREIPRARRVHPGEAELDILLVFMDRPIMQQDPARRLELARLPEGDDERRVAPDLIVDAAGGLIARYDKGVHPPAFAPDLRRDFLEIIGVHGPWIGHEDEVLFDSRLSAEVRRGARLPVGRPRRKAGRTG